MSDTNSLKPAAPTLASARPLTQCRSLAEALQTDEFKRRIDQARPSHIKTDAILNSFLQACSRTPDLLHCEMRSVVGGFLTLAELGLPLTPSLGMAHMMPFRGRVQNPKTRKWEDGYNLTIIIGYQGYIELAMRTGRIGGIHADIVYPEDSQTGIWEYEFGTRQDLRHRPSRERSPQSKPTEAYCIAHIVGDVKPPFEVYPWSKVIGIRDRSQGYLKALAAKNTALAEGKAIPRTFTDAPWVRDEESMAKKTMIRAAQKMWPKSPELRGAAVVDDPERGFVDFGPIMDARPGDVQAADLPVEEEPGDPGAAFGVRETTAAAPQQQPAPKPAASKPAAAKAPPAAPPQQEEPPPAEPGDFGLGNIPQSFEQATPQQTLPEQASEFEAYVLDAQGEAAADGPFSDPVAWARAFSAIWRPEDTEARNAMIEHNMDTLAEARGLPGTADFLRDVIKRQPETKHPLVASAGNPQPIAAPVSRNGKPDWISYMKLIREALPALGVSIAAGPWIEAQVPVLAQCPTTQRLNLIADISKRLGEMGQKPPASLAALVQAKPAAAEAAAGLFESGPNPDRVWIDGKKAEIDKCATVDAIRAITKTDETAAFLSGLRERDAAMVDELVQHAKARANGLGATA